MANNGLERRTAPAAISIVAGVLYAFFLFVASWLMLGIATVNLSPATGASSTWGAIALGLVILFAVLFLTALAIMYRLFRGKSSSFAKLLHVLCLVIFLGTVATALLFDAISRGSIQSAMGVILAISLLYPAIRLAMRLRAGG